MAAVKKSNQLKSQEKFTFSIDFQLEVLRFLIQSKESLLIINKIKPGYFTLIEHALIMEGLRKFVKKYHKIPSQPLLIESCTQLLESKEYIDLITRDDVPGITKLIKTLFSNQLKDHDVVQENILKFAAYIEMKSLNESMDFSNFNLYEDYQNKVSNIIRNSLPQKDEEPLLMVNGTVRRQLMRKMNPNIIPTPYWQLNNLSNANGYPQNSIFVI